MSSQKSNSTQLINIAINLFRAQGYHNTSIADIAAQCGLSKASLYHYIRSKKELALKAMQQVHTHVKENIFCLAYDNSLPFQQSFTLFIKAMEKFLLEQPDGCLMGNFAAEARIMEPEFVEQLELYFSEWAAALTHLIARQVEHEKAQEIAIDIIALTLGTIIMARVNLNYKQQLQYVSQKLLSLFTAANTQDIVTA